MNREFKFELQKVEETGEFVGVAAVYGNVDLGSDMIERGAFTKTLADNGGKVPLLLDHRIPIGIAMIEDSEFGLKTRGILNLEKAVAKDAHSDLKFYHAHSKPYGMSIGYDPVKKRKEGDIRVLKEIRLLETSITLFPMNPQARVSDVKATIQLLLDKPESRELKRLMEFDETMDKVEAWSKRYDIFHALGLAVDSILYDSQASRDDKLSAADASVQQFSKAFTELIPRLVDIIDGRDEKADQAAAFTDLMTLLQKRVAPKPEAVTKNAEPGPVLHSVVQKINDFKFF